MMDEPARAVRAMNGHLPPGTWKPAPGGRGILYCCPHCQVPMGIDFSDIDGTGALPHGLQCPQPTCGWVSTIKLEGYEYVAVPAQGR
ncbi:MAG TPA: hypothetical protein VNX47_01245 [Nevskia sp.]|jgi:hypothetical protein|nr:hypothetical protein [Nevskia sp.]